MSSMKYALKKVTSFVAGAAAVFGIIGILGASGTKAESFSATMNGAGDGHNQYVIESLVDAATDTGAQDLGKAQYEGRVWVDKTVTVNSDDAGIGTEYTVLVSALAQEYRYSTEEYSDAKEKYDAGTAASDTVLPVTTDAENICVTYVDTLGDNTTLVKASGKEYYDLSLVLNGTTYHAAPDSGNANKYYFYQNADSKTGILKSYVLIDSANKTLTWKIHADELAIIKFANRNNPGEQDSAGKVYTACDPIKLVYGISPDDSGITKILTKYSSSSDNRVYTNAWKEGESKVYATYTPTLYNTFYNISGSFASIYRQKAANVTSTLTNLSSAEATSEGVYTDTLGNNGRARGLAKIDISADSTVYTSGDEVTFTIEVTNISDTDLNNLKVTCLLPSVVTFKSTDTDDSGVKQESEITSEPDAWTFDLSAGASKTIKVRATVNDSETSSSTYTAYAYITSINSENLKTAAYDSSDISVKYSIVYNLNGGTASNPASYTFTTDSFTLNNPVKTGYNFVGWTGTGLADDPLTEDTDESKSTSITIEKGSTGNREYTANYTEKTATLKYDANGGIIAAGELVDVAMKYTAETVVSSYEPTRPGHIFKGWSKDKNATVADSKYDPGDTVSAKDSETGLEDTVLYAVWMPVLKIEKYATGSIMPAETIYYSIKITNNTSETITDIMVQDFLPDEVVGFGFTDNDSAGENGITLVSYLGEDKIWKIDSIGAGKSYTFQFRVTGPLDPSKDSYENTAAITSYNGTSLPEDYYLTASATTTIREHITVKYNYVNAPSGRTPSNDHISNQHVDIGTYFSVNKSFAASEVNVYGYTFDGWYTDPSCTSDYLYQDGTQLTLENTTDNVLNLYGIFTEETATLKYDANGGTGAPADQTLKYSERAYVSNTEPTRTGYTFKGWSRTKNGSASYYSGRVYKGAEVMPKDQTLYAVWAENKATYTYKVYESTGGKIKLGNKTALSVSEKIGKLTGTASTVKAVPATGYRFEGWYSDENCTIKVGDADYTPSKDEEVSGVKMYAGGTLYAKFVPLEYKVTYSYDKQYTGASELPEESMHSYTSIVSIEEGCTLAGYTFNGWISLDTNPSVTEDDSSFTMPANDVNLVGSFTPNDGTRYKVEHYLQSLDDSTEYTLEISGIENLTGVTDESVTAVSKNFTGFTYDPDNENNVKSGTVTADGKLVLKLYYTRNAYNVSYSVENAPQGASACPETKEYKYGQTVQIEPDSLASFYTFSGWNQTAKSKEACEVTVTADENNKECFTMPACDVALEGSFTAIEYSIEYELDGGTVSEENPSKYTAESADITLVNPTKIGYVFCGWTGGTKGEDAEVTDALSVTIESGSGENRKYTAKWILEEYTVKYNLEGGEFKDEAGNVIAMPNPEMYTIETEDFTIVNPVMYGHTFTGWTGTGIKGASTAVMVSTGSTGNREYTATWISNDYAVNFIVNGHGDEIPGTNEQETGKLVTEPSEPSETGYTFDGWYLEPQCTTQWDFDTDSMPDDILVLYAKWTPVEYTIKYNLDGGVVGGVNPATYTIEDGDIVLINPEKPGYTFGGWTGTGLEGKDADVTITSGSIGDRVYTAVWVANGGINTGDAYSFELNLILFVSSTLGIFYILMKRRKVR